MELKRVVVTGLGAVTPLGNTYEETWENMQEQVERQDADTAHIEKCRSKLAVLLEQQKDLSTAIDQLLEDISAGRKYMKVYKQMKMYNDPSTNPVLYGKKG